MQSALNEELNSMMRSVSKNVGNFDITPQPLYRGNSSQIFHITNRMDRQSHALKVFDKLSMHGTAKRQSQKGYLIQKKIHQCLKNRFIVQLENTFQDDINYYFMLEYCQNGNLRSKLNQPLPIEVVKDYGLQISKALSYLHKNKIIHGDVKPQNILLTNQNQIKLCDFGLSMKCPEEGSVKGSWGTIGYTSPQTIDMHDQKIDVWSLGCLLYEMASGKLPFTYTSFKEQSTLLSSNYLRELVFDSKITPALQNLLRKIFVLQSSKRPKIDELITHIFFSQKEQGLSSPIIKESKQKKISEIIPRKQESLKRIMRPLKSLQIKEDKENIKQNINRINVIQTQAPDYKKILQKKFKKEDARGKLTISGQTSPQESKPNSGDKNKRKLGEECKFERNAKTKSNLQIAYNVRDNIYQQKKSFRQSPLKTKGMIVKPIKIKKNIIKIDKNWFTHQSETDSEVWFKVSSDGQFIRIRKKQIQKKYTFDQLPQKYFPIYNECKRIVKEIQKQTVKACCCVGEVEVKMMYSGLMQVKVEDSIKQMSVEDMLVNRMNFNEKYYRCVKIIYFGLVQIQKNAILE